MKRREDDVCITVGDIMMRIVIKIMMVMMMMKVTGAHKMSLSHDEENDSKSLW